MQEIKLSGSYYQMGHQYGQQTRKKIRLMSKMVYIFMSLYKVPGAKPFKPNYWYLPLILFNYKKEISKWDKWAEDYIPFIEQHNPDALDFLHGLADGAGITFKQALFLNISTESMYTCSIWGANGTATETGEPLIGTNADDVSDSKGFLFFLDIQPEKGYRYKATGLVGWFIFNHGMNEHGLAVASTLLFLNNPDPKPRPPLLVYQKLLTECKNVAEARAVFENMPDLNSSLVFYVADQENLLKVEITPQGKDYQEIKNGSSGNTNIATLPKAIALDEAPKLKFNENMNAFFRAERMEKLLKMHNGKIDQQVMKDIASDHGEPGTHTHMKSICQHAKKFKYNVITLVSFVAQPREKRFWYSDGNPCESQFEKVELN